MKKVLLDFKLFTVSKKIAFGGGVITGLTGNANVPTPDPPIIDLGAANSLLKGKYELALSKSSVAITERNDAEKEWIKIFELSAINITSECKGDKAKIESTNFHCSKDRGSSPTEIEAPVYTTSNVNIQEALKGKVNRPVGAKFFEVECWPTESHATEAVEHTDKTVVSSATQNFIIPNLKSMLKYSSRARAVGANGVKSPWSSISVCICN